MFKLRPMLRGPVVVTQEFANTTRDAELTGLSFDLVWSSYNGFG